MDEGLRLYYKLAGSDDVRGPFNLGEVRNLERNAVVTAKTHISQNPAGPWKMWADLREAPEFSRTGGASGKVCCVCSVEFPDEETVPFGDHVTCTDCKPLYVQRLQEGVAPNNDPGAKVWRQKKRVVMEHDGVLPDRCVKCNSPAAKRRLTKKMQCASSWY